MEFPLLNQWAGEVTKQAFLFFYIYYTDCFLARRSPPRGALENGSPGGFHAWESLENLIHGTFILIAFSIVISAEIGKDDLFLFGVFLNWIVRIPRELM